MKLIVYGNGKIAKILFEYLKTQHDIVGFTVDRHVLSAPELCGRQVVPFDSVEKIWGSGEHQMLIAVGYAQMNEIRKIKFREAEQKGYRLINYIHPSVHIHDHSKIGRNNVILDGVSIQPGAEIGNNNFIWSNAVIAHGCSIENDCWITSGTIVAGDSSIKSGCFLGVNSSIGHNITIEEKTFVGANCLVTKSTNQGSVYVNRDSEKIRLNSENFMKLAGL